METFYPKAVKRLLKSDFNLGTLGQRDRIVLHSTEGSTASGAIATFEQENVKASSHIVIDRDINSTVYQLMPFEYTAWHASQCNSRSVGIEHVAMNADTADAYNKLYKTKVDSGLMRPFKELLCTEGQYRASAELVAWLCVVLKIPCDRLHILTHNEASPKDRHVKCCTGTTNPDKIVDLAFSILNSK